MSDNSNHWKTKDSLQMKYEAICHQAANDDSCFKTFKSHPYYTPILEHVPFDLGLCHFGNLQKKNPQLLTDHPSVWANDDVGSPKKHQFGDKNASPTTIRYLDILSNLMELWESLDGFRIGEIGGGYGGQCKVINDVFSIEKYTLIDLPGPAALQQRYLREFSLENVEFFNNSSYAKDNAYDLLISCYALSEVPDPFQTEYVKNILLSSQRGYVICNAEIYGTDLLREKFQDLEIREVIDYEHSRWPDNHVIAWGHG